MQPFNFDVATDEASAVQAHSQSKNSRYIAGGTTLVDLMKLHVEAPDLVVDLSSLPLRTIRRDQNTLVIGSMVSNSDFAHHPEVMKNFPMLSQAILAGATAQLRNLASTGGNLLQRTRCQYYRDKAWACNKRDPGSGCSAIKGFNRMHAVLGTSEKCIAAHPSDMCVALSALDARIQVRGADGLRTVAINEFYKKPGDTPHIENGLGADELITAVEIPIVPWFTKSIYVKVRDRASYAFALTSAAVALDLQGEMIRDARIALGGVGTVPWRAKEAEEFLKGKRYSNELALAAAEVAIKGARTSKTNAFKVPMAKNTLVRALNGLALSPGARA